MPPAVEKAPAALRDRVSVPEPREPTVAAELRLLAWVESEEMRVAARSPWAALKAVVME